MKNTHDPSDAKAKPKINVKAQTKAKPASDPVHMRMQGTMGAKTPEHPQKFNKSEIDMRRHFAVDMTDSMPVRAHLLLFIVSGLILSFVIWANFATLEEVTRGDGRIIPSQNIQSLQSLEHAIVEEFLVRRNERVHEGQVLVRLRDIEAASDLGANTTRYFGLLASIIRLQAEAEGKKVLEFPEDVRANAPQSVTEEQNVFQANIQRRRGQIQVLESQRDQRQQELRELETRVSDLRSVIRLVRQERDLLAPLVTRGSAPQLELMQLDRNLRERETELNAALTAAPRARSAIAEAESRIDEIETEAKAQAQNDLTMRMLEMNTIRETLSALQERRTRTEIRAPVNGVIKDILVNTVGGVVRGGDDIIHIVPDDEHLLVEARIRPSDIAFIYPQQPAMVKITAYDFSIYGGLEGEVVEISADTITDERGESYYRVHVRTFEKHLRRRDEVLPIMPGMVAQVDILTGEKTVMEYLLKPFFKTLHESMRER